MATGSFFVFLATDSYVVLETGSAADGDFVFGVTATSVWEKDFCVAEVTLTFFWEAIDGVTWIGASSCLYS